MSARRIQILPDRVAAAAAPSTGEPLYRIGVPAPILQRVCKDPEGSWLGSCKNLGIAVAPTRRGDRAQFIPRYCGTHSVARTLPIGSVPVSNLTASGVPAGVSVPW
jgi:hypothetical protein